MSTKKTYLLWTLLSLITIGSLWFGVSSNYKESVINESANKIEIREEPESETVVISTPDFNDNTPFINNISDKCPANVSVPEQFSCIAKLADETVLKADTLAKKLISVSPQKASTGISFEFGSAESLTYMVDFVSKAQKAKDDYVNNICNLDSMKIYGGSGMDLEQNACIYYYNEQYLRILQSLEHRIIF